MRFNTEFVIAGFFDQERAGPLDGEFIEAQAKSIRAGAAFAKVDFDAGIRADKCADITTEVSGVVIFRVLTAFFGDFARF